MISHALKTAGAETTGRLLTCEAVVSTLDTACKIIENIISVFCFEVLCVEISNKLTEQVIYYLLSLQKYEFKSIIFYMTLIREEILI